ncbi:hypothetical protein TNIN_35551 [Trichonephila inaurata madagascariensis]|uniref:Uncharacterized protein n=1 Tax=Trichonephila inaurata madagascariensis TaxID=2747483 RepID=A0A8X6Y0M5_9ARAC|nr:hypothetical protein TNIN_35551 [Trichonephila inaurata madagascariensis]
MWFQCDMALDHSTNLVLDYGNRTFWSPIDQQRRNRFLGHPIHRIYHDWISFPDGHERRSIRDPFDSEIILVARIVAATCIVQDMAGVFENVRGNGTVNPVFV